MRWGKGKKKRKKSKREEEGGGVERPCLYSSKS